MAPSKKNKQPESSEFLRKYLFLYNFVQLLGWIFVSYQFVNYFLTEPYKSYTLWKHVFVPVAVLQTAAILEIIHVALGFVKTSFVMTFSQIMFRLLNAYGVFNLLPPTVNTVAVPMTLLAWCGAETTRYSFHIFKEMNFLPYFIIWLRYSVFVVLVPIGVSGEILGQYIIQSLYANKWTVLVPNIDIYVGYRHLIILTMIISVQGAIKMYKYLFSLRRKALGTSTGPSQKSK